MNAHIDAHGFVVRTVFRDDEVPTDALEITVNAPGHKLPGVYLHCQQAALVELDRIAVGDILEAGVSILTPEKLDAVIAALVEGRRTLWGDR